MLGRDASSERRCTGNLRFVHRECLNDWRAFDGSAFYCDLCRQDYEFEVAPIRMKSCFVQTLVVIVGLSMVAFFVLCAGLMGAALNEWGAWDEFGFDLVAFWYETKERQQDVMEHTEKYSRVALLGFVGMGITGWVSWLLISLFACFRNGYMHQQPQFHTFHEEEDRRLAENVRRGVDPVARMSFLRPSRLCCAPTDFLNPCPRLYSYACPANPLDGPDCSYTCCSCCSSMLFCGSRSPPPHNPIQPVFNRENRCGASCCSVAMYLCFVAVSFSEQ
uniref:RING-CH-type domain-containing protein n=1 Tax=Chromera velia CCMP2878 TaxID=1169474 RepID=A0A0G4H9R3_9ALVE|eukprot:Cvel_25366.t1-p1 / transcript=Cvel_25366.t1 / gene=Cvel_25366 / organism=Chromera_velia_CCMP2878 / gene_product=hypothetical protein / transcript_product=hypothetical protein / location=Cvel_scaffold2863:17228-19311(+) / protein_length=275 / sequence_SO=supercontig / SO=protein_coding / is_pseudo=false